MVQRYVPCLGVQEDEPPQTFGPGFADADSNSYQTSWRFKPLLHTSCSMFFRAGLLSEAYHCVSVIKLLTNVYRQKQWGSTEKVNMHLLLEDYSSSPIPQMGCWFWHMLLP